jgi:hypothetical protein
MTWQRDITADVERIEKLVGPLVHPLMVSPNSDHFKDKMQLRTVYHEFKNTVARIESESVLCRRINRPTTKYKKLLKDLDQLVEIIENLAVMFKLVY